MFQTTVEMVSSLLFPKVCQTCSALLAITDKTGVCTDCVAHLQKIRPPFCPGCGRRTHEEKKRCVECASENFFFDHAYSVCYYDGKAKELLQAFKFSGIHSLRRFFSKLLVDFFNTHLSAGDFDLVLAVPMTSSRENKRGYNQAHLLAKDLSRLSGLPLASEVLRRKKTPQTQASLGKKERNNNILGSFFVQKPLAVLHQRILIIDDIMTSGSTASECAKVLKEAGSAHVAVLTVARGF